MPDLIQSSNTCPRPVALPPEEFHDPFVPNPDDYTQPDFVNMYGMNEVEPASGLARYLRDIDKLPRISKRRECELIGSVQIGGDMSARNELIETTLHQTAAIIRKAHSRDTPLGNALDRQDFIGPSIPAIVRAIETYNPKTQSIRDKSPKVQQTKGQPKRLTTHAFSRIRQSMHKELFNNSRTIPIKTDKFQEIRTMWRTQWELVGRLGRRCTVGELAQATDSSEEIINQNIAIWVNQTPLSLERPVRVSGHTFAKLGDTVTGKTFPSPEDLEFTREIKTGIEKALGNLSPQYRKIVKQYFGLGEFKQPSTFEQIAKKMGDASRQSIQMKFAKAIDKLRRPGRTRRKLREYLNYL